MENSDDSVCPTTYYSTTNHTNINPNTAKTLDTYKYPSDGSTFYTSILPIFPSKPRINYINNQKYAYNYSHHITCLIYLIYINL